MTEVHAGVGSVPVVLRLADGSGDEHLNLVPTYHAARTLSAQYGGLMKVIEALGRIDIDAIVTVVTLGLGYGPPGRHPPRDLADRIWATGFSDDSGRLAEHCVTYVRTLMTGGRPVKQDDAASTGGGDEDPTRP